MPKPDLTEFHEAIQEVAYKTFKGLNGNQWKVLVSHRYRSNQRVLYIQDTARHCHISGLFPADLDAGVFRFALRDGGGTYLLWMDGEKIRYESRDKTA